MPSESGGERERVLLKLQQETNYFCFSRLDNETKWLPAKEGENKTKKRAREDKPECKILLCDSTKNFVLKTIQNRDKRTQHHHPNDHWAIMHSFSQFYFLSFTHFHSFFSYTKVLFLQST